MKFPKIRLPLGKRGGRPADEDEDEVEDEEEELEEDRGSGQTPAASFPAASISAARLSQKKRSPLLIFGVAALLLVVCSICALVYLAIPDAGTQVDVSALPATTQTAIWVQTRAAEAATQYAPKTPVSGPGSLNAKATPSVIKTPSAGGLPPTASGGITTTVGISSTPPALREYNDTWEIVRTLVGLLLFSVLIFGGLAAITSWLSFPIPMPDQHTEIAYGEGTITVDWSLYAQKRTARTIPLLELIPLLRFRLLGREAIEELVEGLQSVIQAFGQSVPVSEEMRKDFARFFDEFNFALDQERQGSSYEKNLLRQRSGGIPENHRYILPQICKALKELRDLEGRQGILVIRFFLGKDFAQPSADLKAHFDSLRDEEQARAELKETDARERRERRAMLRDQRAELERQRLGQEVAAAAVAIKVNTYCMKRGIKPESLEALEAAKTFLAQEKARVEQEAVERLRSLELEFQREELRHKGTVDTELAQAQTLQARALQDGVQALHEALENLDVNAIVRSLISGRLPRGGNGNHTEEGEQQ